MDWKSSLLVIVMASVVLVSNYLFGLNLDSVVGSFLVAGVCALWIGLELRSEEEEKEWAFIGVFSVLGVLEIVTVGTTIIGWGEINPLIGGVSAVLIVVGIIIHFTCYRFNLFPKPV